MAASADVRVDAASGAIRVLRMCCVQDVGLAINPDQLEAQIEGNLIWGLGMALMERVEIGQSEITSLNFDRYAIPRIHDVPEFDIEIVSPRARPARRRRRDGPDRRPARHRQRPASSHRPALHGAPDSQSRALTRSGRGSWAAARSDDRRATALCHGPSA